LNFTETGSATVFEDADLALRFFMIQVYHF
jgi:hypothetical protein